MSDFFSAFWPWYIAIATLVSIVGCGVFLWMQSSQRLPKGQQADLHGHVWDENLSEYNNPLPRWWMWLFYVTIFFSLIYLALYPGLGDFAGSYGWTQKSQYDAEVKQMEEATQPLFNQFAGVDIPTLAKDREANAIGQRLFLNNCAQCHGSDAGGGKGFPSLRDKDWLYGGDPATITASITDGRNGVMPPLGEAIGGEAGMKEMAEYVRSLSGLKHDAAMAQAAQPKFVICGACHGMDGKGNRALGAPNLTDEVWLYGSSAADIMTTIRNGRGSNTLTPGQSAMPAHKDKLSPAKIHLLAAYVYSLGGGEAPVEAANK
ncbi:MAG: cytochrome-c oxidase, cbb3-type subunit III [Betaproteobacteria bacterium]|nr:cytochrome-c oxidase, cbb3-type subunit III [Betaproteobacteria bacterium]